MMNTTLSTLVAGVIALASTSAFAVDIYTNDFSGASPLADWVLSQPAGSDIEISNSEGNPLPSLRLSDTDNTAYASGRYTISDISSQAPGNTLNYSFDWNITSFATALANTAANPRMVLQVNDTDFLSLGFGRRGGYPQGTCLFFYVSDSSGAVIPTVTDTNAAAIGYTSGSGWADGSFFGNYNSEDASANSTDGWIHFELSYVSGDDTVYGTMINGENTITFSWAVDATTLESMDEFTILVESGSSSQSDFYIDNMDVSVIPEPSQSALGLLGGLLIVFCVYRKVRR